MIEALEIERKYEVDEPLEPSLDGLPGVSVSGPERQALDAAYYDTADLRLVRAGVTLRRRRGGTDSGWHLKLPAGGPDERVELRLPLGRSRGVPAELRDLTLSRTRGATLAPVARLRTERMLWQLVADGSPVAEVVADVVHAEPVDGSPVSWSELEVELTGGDRDLLDLVEERLLAQGARPSSSSSKIGKVLAPPPPADLDLPSGSAGAVIMDALGTHIDAMLAADPKVRRDQPDAVHRLRVSARRARSVLQSFRRILDRSRTEPLVDELRWLGRVLTDARDAEVQRARQLARLADLPSELVTGPVVSHIDSHLFAEYTRAREAALADLRGPRYLALLDLLDLVLADPPLADRASGKASSVLPPLVARAERRMHRAYQRYQTGSDPDAALHAVRKAAKRARYAAETAGKRGRARRNKAVQSLLGDHQDAVVSRDLLRRLGTQANTEGNGFTYGVLLGQDLAEAARLRAELPTVWKRVK